MEIQVLPEPNYPVSPEENATISPGREHNDRFEDGKHI